MPSSVDISNMALAHLGARTQVSSISPPDGSVEAGYCARFYPLARRELLELAPWSFSETRAPLAPLVNDSDFWLYAYALPSNCITPLRVLVQGRPERESALFTQEGGVIYTDEEDATLVYTQDITDTTRFGPLFSSTLSMLLAAYLAGPIIKGLDGARTGATWRQNALVAAGLAAAADANHANTSEGHTPSSIQARE